MPVMRNFVLAIILLCRINDLYSQSYSFSHYQVENGLSNNSVMCSLQDKMGFMWFGTKDGLNRFDGYTFKTFRKAPEVQGSIGNNFIHSLYEDEQGMLWVGTSKGLYQYNRSTEKFSLDSATSNLEIQKIIEDKRGNFWFISGFALYRYLKQTKRLHYYNPAKFFNATSLCTTTDGSVWVGTMKGEINRYDSEKDAFYSLDLFLHSKPIETRSVESLYAMENGFLMVGTSNTEIKLIDPSRLTYKDITLRCSNQRNLYIRSIQQTSVDEFWLGTESGVVVYNMKTAACIPVTKDYSNPYSISDNAVYTFCRDREGSVWVGTYFGGINYYPKQYAPFTKYFPRKGENSLSGNVVREIRKDPYGYLWIGTEDAGLNKWDPHSGRFTYFMPGNSGLSFFNIHGLMVTGNELWIGTFEHGLDVMDIRTGKVKRHFRKGPGSELVSSFIYCFYALSPDDILISTPSGMFDFNKKKDSLKWFDGLPPWTWYSAILKDSRGRLWMGTFGKGVYYKDVATGKNGIFSYQEQDTNSLASDRVNAIFEDSEKTLWVATEEGLCKWNARTGNFTRYGTANGFPSNFILSILEDSQHNLWVSTTKGLVRFTPATAKIQVYTTANGLLSDQFNYNSAFKDDDGRMYFGSTKGMISFRPEEFSQNRFTPPVYITGILVNNQEIEIASKGSILQESIIYTRQLTLAHNQSTISLDFAAPGYSAPDMIRYSYQMQGLSNTWVDLKTNRRVHFLELPAGTYVFRVKASDQNGNLNPQEARLTIVVLPHWWASTWAKVAYTVLILLLVYYLVRSYHWKMEEKSRRKLERVQMTKEKEILEMRLSREKEILAAKVDFFTNVAHEIRTPLTLIKVPLARIMRKAEYSAEFTNSIKIIERNTNRLIDLTNQLLDFRQTEVNKFHLSIKEADIVALLEEASIGFSTLAEQNNISLLLHVPNKTLSASIDVDAFNKIIYNLFSNAVKYAQSKVEIDLVPHLKDDDTFTIEVKNDGYLIPDELKEKIFEPFFRIREAETIGATGTGIGLALSRSLVKLHNGMLALESPRDNMNVFSLTLPIYHKANTPPQNLSSIYSEPPLENINQ